LLFQEVAQKEPWEAVFEYKILYFHKNYQGFQMVEENQNNSGKSVGFTCFTLCRKMFGKPFAR